eukprot:scaffold13472_cov129-Isochrysis_galbana.AAC.1
MHRREREGGSSARGEWGLTTACNYCRAKLELPHVTTGHAWADGGASHSVSVQCAIFLSTAKLPHLHQRARASSV